MDNNFKLNQIYIGILLIFSGVNYSHANIMENDKFSINLRNFYFDRQFSQPEVQDIGSWSQGVMAYYESGYIDTPIQLGIDASLKYALRLSDYQTDFPDTNLPYDQKKAELYRSYEKYGLTLKFKYKNTDVKIGELHPKMPVVYLDDARQLPTSYAGILFESSDFNNLKITAGLVTHINARNDDRYRKLSLYTSGTRHESDGLTFIGLDYNIKPNFKLDYWFGQLQDIYQQNYIGATYSKDLNNIKFKLDSSYFYNKEDGEKLYGEIDSQALGFMGTLFYKNHTLILGMQKNRGESFFPTLAGYPPQPYLQAWSNLPFINPEEQIWHITYTYDFRDIGLNGFKSRMSYHHGDNIKRKDLADNKESEKILGLTYTVPDGRFKGLGFEWRYTETDVKYGTGYNPGNDFKENRFITTYSFNF